MPLNIEDLEERLIELKQERKDLAADIRKLTIVIEELKKFRKYEEGVNDEVS